MSMGFHWDDEDWDGGFGMGHGATIHFRLPRNLNSSIRTHSPQLTERGRRKLRRAK